MTPPPGGTPAFRLAGVTSQNLAGGFQGALSGQLAVPAADLAGYRLCAGLYRTWDCMTPGQPRGGAVFRGRRLAMTIGTDDPERPLAIRRELAGH